MLAGSGDRFVREGEREAKGPVDMKGEHEVSYQLDLFIICLQWSMAKPTQVTQLYGNNTERFLVYFSQLSSKETFCKTIVECHNQDIELDTIHLGTQTLYQ